MRRLLLLPLTFVLIPLVVLAQADACPAIVKAAYSSALLECAAVEAGQLCYGSSRLDIDPPNDDFSRPGYVVNMHELKTLTSSPMDVDDGQWGIAVARAALQQNQTMTLVVVGDVTLENLIEATTPVIYVDVRVTFSAGANVREESGEDSALMTSLPSGQDVPATGSSNDRAWLRLLLPDGSAGWVRTDLVQPSGDIEQLPIVEAGDVGPRSLSGPWQAFNLRSGAADALCTAAPESGVMLQADDGAGEISLTVNGVLLTFPGTAYLQAREGGELSVAALEDNVRVLSAGVEQVAIPGTRIRVRWDAERGVPGAPRDLEHYEYARLRVLPLALLPRPVESSLVVNLLGVVTPAAPSPLDGITGGSICTIAAFNDEGRLRAGPGREYSIVGGLRSGESANPDGRALALDGTRWWRLREGLWAREDVVYAAGMCSSLPLIEELPPAAASSPQNAAWNWMSVQG